MLVLVGVVLILAVLSVVIEQKTSKKIVEEAKIRFEGWQRELEGRYREIDGRRGEIFTNVDKERETYKEKATRLEEKINSIDSSLGMLSRDAVQEVRNMAGVIQPVLSMFRTPQMAGIKYAEIELELLLKTQLGEGLYERKPRSLAFGNETVDFVIKLPECLVPIDSKFPEAVYRNWVEAESEDDQRTRWRLFRNEVVKQLESAAKYIRPDKGTTDYALLFFPSDIIWQQAFLVSKHYGEENPILAKSQELRVFGCAAQTLLPYLGLLRLGLRNLKISEDVKAVQRQISQLSVTSEKFARDWDLLKSHLDKAQNVISNVDSTRGSLFVLQKTIAALNDHAQQPPEVAEITPMEPQEIEQVVKVNGG